MDNKNQKIDAIDSHELTFAQINLRHHKRATANLCQDLMTTQTDITFIQEPWIRGNKVNGFGLLHKRLFYNRAGIRPRAALHVSPRVQALLLNQFTVDDVVAVRICRSLEDGGDFIVASVYMPYDSPEPRPGKALGNVVEFCDKGRIQLIIGSDSNAHHEIWNSTDTNDRGEQLVQYLIC